MSSRREISQEDFQLESLEPRLLLNGVSWVGSAAGGDWNTASNWSGGALPTFGDDVTIANLNPGAVVTASGTNASQLNSLTLTGATLTISGTAHFTPFTTTLSAGATLNITGGSEFAGESITSQGSTVNVSGGSIFDLFSSSSQSAGSLISVADTSQFNLGGAFFESTDSAINLTGSAELTAGAAQLKIDQTQAPVVDALHASDNSVIDIDEGNLIVGSSVILDGKAQLQVVDQGTLSFSDATNGIVNALASNPDPVGGVLTPAIFFDATANLTGPGEIESVNATFGGIITPGGSEQALQLGISGQTNFQPGTVVEAEIFNNFEFSNAVAFFDPVSGAGTYQYNLSGLSLNMTLAPGVTMGTQFTTFFSFPVDPIAFSAPTTTFTGTLGLVKPIWNFNASSGVGFNGYPIALEPVISLTTTGGDIGYTPVVVGVNSTFTYTGPPGGSWNNPANWELTTTSNPGTPITDTGPPTFLSNVVIPGGLASGPVISGGTVTLNSLQDGSSLTVSNNAQVFVTSLGNVGIDDGTFVPPTPSYINGGLTLNSGITELNDTFGTTTLEGSVVSNGGVLIIAGHVTLVGSASFGVGEFVFDSGWTFSLAAGSTFTTTDTFIVPPSATFNDAGTLTAAGVDIYGNVNIADVLTDNPGTAVINGDVTLEFSFSTIGLEVFGPAASQASLLTINGTLAGSGTVFVAFGSFSPVDATYTLVVATGGISATPSFNLPGLMSADTSNPNQFSFTVLLNSGSNQELQAGLADLSSFVANWASYFDLSKINTSAQGIAGFNLPISTNELASLFNLNSALSGFTLPLVGQAGTNQELYDSLTGAGYSVQSLQGTLFTPSDVFIPDLGNGILVQAAFQTTLLATLTVPNGYAGQQFNSGSPGLLDGLVNGSPVNGALTWTASLTINLVFGVDGNGFYVGSGSTMVLALAAAGNISTTTTVAGQGGTSLTGTAAANLNVTLSVNGHQTLAAVSGDLSTILAPTATGTASVSLAFTLGPAISLNYGASYTLTQNLSSLVTTDVEVETLSGTLNFPGITNAGGTPLVLNLTGTLSAGTWSLSSQALNGQKLAGFTINSGALTLALTPTSFVGAGTLLYSQTAVENLGAGNNFVFSVAVTFTPTGGTLTASKALNAAAIDSDTGATMLEANVPVTVDMSMAANFTAGTLTGTMTFTSSSGIFAPATTYSSAVTDGNSDGTAFTFSYDFATQVYTMVLDTLTVTDPFLFSFSATNVTLDYDRHVGAGTEATLGTLSNQTVTLLAFGNVSTTGPPSPSFTTTVLLQQDGFTLGSATPFTLTNVEIGPEITLASASVTFAATSFTQGVTPVGTLSFAPTTAALYPNAAAVIGVAAGLEGTLSLSTTIWDLDAVSITITMGEAFSIAQTGATMTYDLSLGSTFQVLGTLNSATASSVEIQGLSSAPVSTVFLNSNGMGINGAFTLSPTTGTDSHIGSYLTLINSSISVSTFGFQVGPSGTIFGGFINVSLSNIKIYPSIPVIVTTPTSLSASFDLTGSASTGDLTITMSHLNIALGSALQVDADNVTITPDRSILVTIPTATLTSQVFSDMTGTLTDFKLTQTGFSIGTATLATPVGGTSTLRVPTKPIRVATLTTVSLTISNFAYDTTSGLSGTIALTAFQATLFPDSSTFSAVGTNVTGGYLVDSAGISVLTFNIASWQVSFGSIFQLAGTNLSVTPEASTVVTVGSVTGTLVFPTGTVGATGGNFAIMSDGSLVTLPGFGVSLNNTTSGGVLDFPSWMPISITSLGLSWANFEADPTHFDIVLSASITGLNGLPLSVSGAVTGLVIDPSLLAEGEMPIVSVGSFSITVSGTMFGAQVSGSIALGVLRLDSTGQVINAGDTTTPVASSIFYGAIQGSATFANLTGFSIDIGLSTYGPLNVYIGATTNILLDPDTGLTLQGVAAGVLFNTSLPTITDPHDLRDQQFQQVAPQTGPQWLAALQLSVYQQSQAPPSTSFWSAFSNTMEIKGSATLTSLQDPNMTGVVNILVSTDGKFAATGVFNFGSSLNLTVDLYANLTQVQSGTAQFLFLSDSPAPPASPKFTIFGSLAISIASGVDTFTLTGGVTLTKGLSLTISGTVILTFDTADELYTMQVAGSVDLPILGNALGVAGTFELNMADPNNPQFWGAMNVSTNLSALSSLGIAATGTALFRVNTTTSVQSLTFTIPGQSLPTTVSLPADDLSVFLQGTLGFSHSSSQWFQLTGQFGFEISASSVLMSDTATLTVGPTGADFLEFDSTGYMQLSAAGIAAQFAITLDTGIPPPSGFALSGTFIFQINTTGVAVTYTTPGGSFTIPAAPTGVPNAVAGPYAVVTGSATIVLSSEFTLTGTLSLVFQGTTLSGSLTNGAFSLNVNGTNLFTFNFSGAFQVSKAGAFGTFTLGATASSNASSFGFGIAGLFVMNFNTTGTAETIGGVQLGAGPFAQVVVVATMSLTGNTGVVITGTMTFTATTTQVTVALTSGLASFEISGTQIMQFSLVGGFTIIDRDANDKGVAMDLATSFAASVSSLGISLTGTFVFQLNTTASAQTVAGVSVAAQSAGVSVTNAALTIYGAVMSGSFSIAASSSGVTMTASSSIAFKSGSTTIFGFTANGAMTFTSSGLTAVLTISQNVTFPAVTLSGTLQLQVNTTSTSQTVGGVAIAAGLVQVAGTGSVTIAGATMTGSFKVFATVATASAGTIGFSVTGTLAIASGGTKYFNLLVNGGLQIGPAGVAADLTVTLTVASGITNLTLNGSATLEINTTGAAVTVGGVTLAAGNYVLVSITAPLSLGGASGLPIQGTVTVKLSSGTLTLSVSGTLTLGTTSSPNLLTFAASGTIVLSSSGIVGVVALQTPTGLSSTYVGFSLSFVAEINTLNTPQSVTALNASGALTNYSIGAGPTFSVVAQGTLTVGGFAITGTLTLTGGGTSYVSASVVGTVGLFGSSLSISGGFEIMPDGVALYLTLSAGTVYGSGFTVSGTFSLALNSTSNYQLAIQPHTFEAGVIGATLSIDGFSMKGSLIIGYTNGVAFVEIPSWSPVTVNVFNLLAVNISGSVSSNGNFTFTGSGTMQVGDYYATVLGSVSVTISNSGVSGTFNGAVNLFGTQVATVSGSVTSSSFTVTANVSTSIPGVNFTMNGSATFTVTGSDVSADFRGSGKLFGGVNLSTELKIDTASAYFLATGSMSVSVGGSDIGASVSGSVTVSSDATQDGISLSGSAWAGFYVWNPFGSDWWVGATVKISGAGGLSGKFSFSFSVSGTGFSVSVNLTTIVQALGSDLSGGFAFFDTNGSGVWDPSEPRVPVDSDGSFSFQVGDPSLWVVDSAGGYAFYNSDGTGTWDPTTEARVPLVNGQLPAYISAAASTTTAGTALGLLQNYAVAGAGGTQVLNISQGQVLAVGGEVLNPSTGLVTANTGTVQLGGIIAGYTGLVGPGQVVFFDANGNGVMDPGEIEVQADSRGFYTFNPGQQKLAALGLLAPYAGSNGQVDPGLGSIVVTGSIDKNNGQPADTIIRINAQNYGTGLAVTAQPLAALENTLINLSGYTAAQMDTRLSLVFGLPVGISFATIDPQTNAGLTSAQSQAVLTITNQLESFLQTTSALLVDSGVSAGAAQTAALDAVADRVLQNFTNQGQGTISPSDMLDFTNLATVTGMLNDALSRAGVSVSGATVTALATVTAGLNQAAAGYLATSSDLARDLSRISSVLVGALTTDIGNLADANLSAPAFTADYTGSALQALLANVALTAITAPTVTGLTNVTSTPGGPLTVLTLGITTATGISDNVTLTATSSNTGFLPDASISFQGSGATRYLIITSPGTTGSATITVTATIDGASVQDTFTFTSAPAAPAGPQIFSSAPRSSGVGLQYSYGFVSAPARVGDTVAVTAAGLPSWLTFTDNGDGTAVLTGTPGASDLGANTVVLYNITLTVTESNGGVSTQVFTLALLPAGVSGPSFTTNAPTFTLPAGTPLSYTVQATPGDGGTTVAFTGANLPSWLTLTDNGDGTATLTGTPGNGDVGFDEITLIATNDLGVSSTQVIDFAIGTTFASSVPAPGSGGGSTAPTASAPIFQTSPLKGPIIAGQPVSFPVVVSPGAGASVVVISGTTLPPWLTVTDNGNGTALLTGTAPLGTSGTFVVSITATNDQGQSTVQTFGVVVDSGLTLSPVSGVTISENGYADITLTLGGIDSGATLVASSSNSSLLSQAGLTLGGAGATRSLVITPTAGAYGTATVTLTLADNGVTSTQTFTLTVTPVDTPVTQVAQLPSLTVLPGSAPVTVDLSKIFQAGGGVITYSAVGSAATLANLKISGSILTITPGTAASGLDSITIVATSVGQASGKTTTASGSIALTVVPQISVSAAQVVQLGGGHAMQFTVTLLTPSNQTVLVGYSTQNGTALAGVDYVATSGTLQFSPGTTVLTIDVPILGSLLVDPASFTIGLGGAQNGVVMNGSATAQIPADRGQLSGLVQLPELSISFTFLEFVTAAPSENPYLLSPLLLTTEVVLVSSVGAPSSAPLFVASAPVSPLEAATSLGSLETVSAMHGY